MFVTSSISSQKEPEMPMTATGKIHKLTLREQFRDYQLPTA